ncbi:MAG: c-type cytochrome, partial [Bacteroidetes bacterium]|nr:c-type cytochrome [Bacteroidota bacterium]
AEYIPSGMRWEQLLAYQEKGLLAPGVVLRHLDAQTLISQYNCVSCHKIDSTLVGPPFRAVAQKYREKKTAFEQLAKSILEGSDGKWGSEIAMPPNPMLSQTETHQIIDYILSLAAPEKESRTLPIRGSFKTEAYPLQGNGGRLGSFFPLTFEPGAYVFYASYTDEGSPQATDLQLRGEDVVLLRYPLLAPETADTLSAEGISFTPSTNDPGFIFTGKGGFIGFRGLDLTGINTIRIGAITRFWHWSHFIGATLELRLGSPTGRLIGKPYERVPPAVEAGDGPFFGDAGGKPIPVDVSAVNGVHDVYIVVSNPKAEERDALLIMTGISFEQ